MRNICLVLMAGFVLLGFNACVDGRATTNRNASPGIFSPSSLTLEESHTIQ